MKITNVPDANIKMETPVKPINKRTEVAGSVFGEIKRVVSATQAGFEVAQTPIDPVELR